MLKTNCRGRPKGTKLSTKTKAKIAKSMTDKIKSESTKEKISKSLLDHFSTFDKINEICNNLGYTFLNTTYKGVNDKIQYIDNAGVLHTTPWVNFCRTTTFAKYDTVADRLS